MRKIVRARSAFMAIALMMGTEGNAVQIEDVARESNVAQLSPWRQCRQNSTYWVCLGRLVTGRLNQPGSVPVPIPEPQRLPPLPEPYIPPAPPTIACNVGPYMVFFDWDEDTISTDATGVLDNAVSAYAGCGDTQIMIAGHADRSGEPSYNVGLSHRRANNVRDYLAARGIAGNVMTTMALGEAQPQVLTVDGERHPLNRRVEITYYPRSGM